MLLCNSPLCMKRHSQGLESCLCKEALHGKNGYNWTYVHPERDMFARHFLFVIMSGVLFLLVQVT